MDLNSFFDSATPAQINQLTASPPKQEAQPQQQVPQQHPSIAMAQLDDLPQADYTEAQPDLPAQQEQSVQQVQEIQQPVKEESTETPQQMRFREIREAKLKAEWERDELARRLQSYEEARNRPQQHAQKEEDEDLGIDPDAIIEGKDIAKIVKHIEQKTERRYQRQQQAMMQNVVENRLKMEMPDIESVVSTENVRQLQQMYPELAQSINSNQDYYTKAKAAYTMIKKLNIAQEPVAQSQYDYEADRRRIAQNVSKPRAVQTAAQRQSPLAASNAYDGELTDAIKSTYWKEMQKAMKG